MRLMPGKVKQPILG